MLAKPIGFRILPSSAGMLVWSQISTLLNTLRLFLLSEEWLKLEVGDEIRYDFSRYKGPKNDVVIFNHILTYLKDQPIFTRMLDKDSRWGYNNGLRSLIPTLLHFGILGYPVSC